MGLEGGGAGRVKGGCLLRHPPGMGPRDRTALQRSEGPGQGGCQGMGLGQQGTGGTVTDHQCTPDLGHQAPLLGRGLMR